MFPACQKLSLSALLVVGLSGCSGERFQPVPVSGTISCGGKTLVSGIVFFTPLEKDEKGISGKSAGGRVSPEGKFVLSTYGNNDGAMPGRHRVVWVPEDDTPEAPKQKVSCAPESFAEVEIPEDGILDLAVDLQK